MMLSLLGSSRSKERGLRPEQWLSLAVNSLFCPSIREGWIDCMPVMLGWLRTDSCILDVLIQH